MYESETSYQYAGSVGILGASSLSMQRKLLGCVDCVVVFVMIGVFLRKTQ